MSRRALISTIYSPVGGVTTMTRAVADFLRDEGWEVSLAYYMPWSEAPGLSVRLPDLGSDGPGWRVRSWEGDDTYEAYEVGVRYPELEWRRYRLNEGWRRAVEDHDVHLVVSGNLLPAAPIRAADLPCMAWIATTYWPDKRDRLREYRWPRRLFDLAVNTPAGLIRERRLAREVRLLALSEHTAQEFESLRGEKPSVLPMGVDTELFRPQEVGERDRSRDSHRIGFVGRLEDPRKNVSLLIELLEELRARGTGVELHLVGGELADELREQAREASLEDRLTVTGHMTPEDLADYYRNLDAFVIPSHQEGLAIVGLEAMACGCPVISTRCGGPEEYVEDGVNGFLVGFDAGEMADAVERVIEDRDVRREMARRAVETVGNGYRLADTERIFWREFERTFHRPGGRNG